MCVDNRTPQSISVFELPPDQFLGLLGFFALGAVAWLMDLVLRHGLLGAIKAVMDIVR